MIGKRVMVKNYVKGTEAGEQVVYALPGETGVVMCTNAEDLSLSVVFDRTGYKADISPSDVEPAGWRVDIRPL